MKEESAGSIGVMYIVKEAKVLPECNNEWCVNTFSPYRLCRLDATKLFVDIVWCFISKQLK